MRVKMAQNKMVQILRRFNNAILWRNNYVIK